MGITKYYKVGLDEHGQYFIHDETGRPVTRWNRDELIHKTVFFKTGNQASSWLKRIQDSHASRLAWRDIWNQALANMPRKRSTKRVVKWEAVNGATTVPDYIKGIAKKRMRLFDGKVHLKHVEISHHFYGQFRCLALLLGYMTTNKRTGKKSAHGLRVSTARACGNRPRDPVKRELLEKLAGARGNALAVDMLTNLGIIHKYYIK